MCPRTVRRCSISSSPPERRLELEMRARTQGGGWRLPGPRVGLWDEIVRDSYGVGEDDASWMVARLRSHPLKALTQPVHRTSPAAAQLPRTYIRCTRYESRAFDGFAAEARRAGSGWRHREIDTSHEAMVTAANDLVRLLLEVV